MIPQAGRIACIHALEESIAPTREAFALAWPEAQYFHVFDSSLAADRSRGVAESELLARFRNLLHHAVTTGGGGIPTSGALFTCSAFGEIIDTLKGEMPLPMLRPNEAAFEQALSTGSRIGLIVTFHPSGAMLARELAEAAGSSGREVEVILKVADGALAALKDGDAQLHDESIAAAARSVAGSVDCIVLGQFSMARAKAEVESETGLPTITTPESAVRSMRRLTGQ